MQWDETSSCTGKTRYPGRKYARRALRAINGEGRGHKTLHCYACSYCGSWHIGHRPLPEYLRSA
jgi:hypothetical protein